MTNNEMAFLLRQWGQEFTTLVITEVSRYNKNPDGDVVLAVAVGQILAKLNAMPTSGFDKVIIPPPDTANPTT